MSQFSFIKPVNEELYQACFEAEKKVRTQPSLALTKMRMALEIFVRDIISRSSLPLGFGDTLARGISSVEEKRILPPQIISNMKEIKDNANDTVHPESLRNKKKRPGARVGPTEQAIIFLGNLQNMIWVYYNKVQPLDKTGFDANLLPMGNFSVVEVLPLRKGEACFRKFRAWRVDPNTGHKAHAIIRQYTADGPSEFVREFKKRDLRALQARWAEDPPPLNIVNYEDIPVDKECEYIYVAFFVPEQAEILADFNLAAIGYFERIQILQAIANGVLDLHTMEYPIAHRMLSPESIYVFEQKNKLTAKICNFEYAKLLLPNCFSTVFGLVYQVANAYKAPELSIGLEDQKETDYRLADIYSLGKIAEFLLKDDSNNCTTRNIITLVDRMVQRQPQDRPNIEEVKTAIELEIDNFKKV